jgi:hypothetical protein
MKLRETLEPSLTVYFSTIENKMDIKRKNLFKYLPAFLITYLVYGFARDFFCNFVIGFIFPAYASIVSVEDPERNNRPKWLIYWVVYAFFGLMEYFGDFFLHTFYYFWPLLAWFLLIFRVVYAFFWGLIEYFFNYFYYPTNYYWLLKSGFLILMMTSDLYGLTRQLYQEFIRPFVSWIQKQLKRANITRSKTH